ncbi:MAG: glycosyltransferase family 4 protein [Microcoleus sp. PH2017_25_DOB_D_A]|uniref:glycosyltransferase family 4 protein n=1 Tax=unclassified Microcoleus TaxID=2642155 RepID=UPI001D34BD65|nr:MULTISPECIES: glycosyltransferase family 4 protein [unclassified Microcoleus]MCC3490218.1 glycosyltransferase family 4 protein [Microcoleus sp. PH2017_16_JOR_D_A]MCC3533874.1 glycosyltransferase family 4 protein [Microcoleus sp. PH2017_25_DOB_D_A]MCC3545985.1 glycosyltransferase family 4 protein [Microcoleus sp. PH2017_24_DOB_U_A]TAE44416.1 MAG: glycosyltransferase [Oscillatoriales cyanobacterium]
MLNISSLFTFYCGGQGISHTFLSLCQWDYPDFKTRMVVPSCAPSYRGYNMVESVPPYFRRVYYRLGNFAQSSAEKRFLRDINDFDAVYLWPRTSIETVRKVKQQGQTLFFERINCSTKKAKYILDDAYGRLGIAPEHGITDAMIQQEDEEMSLADFIFSPSPEVKKSFLEIGVPEYKLMSSSYGWCPKRFPNISPKKQPSDTVTALFVGTICVRKGAHLLLQAWEKAGIKGRLVLCGEMEPAIAESCSDILGRSDVIHIDYTLNIAGVYGEADIFAFPSLEDGGPMVTYEAMAYGLPVLTSPMGAGAIARDGKDGIVIDPYDCEAFVEGLRKLALSPELRAQMGYNARQQAEEFTWEKVARRRKDLMQEKLKV